MSAIHPNVLLILLIVVPFGVMIGTVWSVAKLHRRNSRSPLSHGLIRVPGHRLIQQIIDAHTDLSAYVFLASISLLWPVGLAAFQNWKLGTEPTTVLLGTLGVSLLAFSAYKLATTIKRISNLRLGLHAELDTAHHLGKLAAKGYHIYHDIPAAGFNIDHLVIGPNGVFAIETKGRRKPRLTNPRTGQRPHEIICESRRLRFPKFTDERFIEQAERQARWCAEWLTRAVGTHIEVTPVLCFPGWYITYGKQPTPFPIVTSKAIGSALMRRHSTPLEAQLVRQIVYQVEQRATTEESPVDPLSAKPSRSTA
jgi:hypothetical protein